jgi:hypothetical protein
MSVVERDRSSALPHRVKPSRRSIFEHITSSFGIQAVLTAASTVAKKNFDELEVDDLREFLRCLQPGESYDAVFPDLIEPEEENRRLWSWRHLEDEPARITDIWCRVTHSAMISHLVLEDVEFGFEDLDTGAFVNAVRVTTTTGDVLMLPLTKEMVDSRWVAFDGYLPEDGYALWPLEARLDKALVIPFVYEIEQDLTIKRWRDQPPGSDDDRTAREMMMAAELELAASPPQARPPAPGNDGALDTEEFAVSEPWGTRIRQGDVMADGAGTAAAGGAIPHQAKARTEPTRIIVILSFSVCRQRGDFDPGGIGKQGRCYPHIMVRANIPLREIEATVRLNRPAQTTMMDPPNGYETGPRSCCLQYDAPNKDIHSLFVADDNDEVNALNPAPFPLPFWGNFFAYFQADAYENNKGKAVKMVRTDRTHKVSVDDPMFTRIVQPAMPGLAGLLDSVGGNHKTRTTITKWGRQGEFDNLHLAPALRLVGATHFVLPGFERPFRIDRDSLHLDDIVMAPICAHDCFHLHTRWGAIATSKWALGWDESGPYRVPGAPMVPTNQQVWFRLRSNHEVSYHVQIGQDEEGGSSIEPLAWQVIFHHGCGYLIQLDWKAHLLNLGMDMLAKPCFYSIPNPSEDGANLSLAPAPFLYPIIPSLPAVIDAPTGALGSRDTYLPISHADSTALFYWHVRWCFRQTEQDETKFELSERIPIDGAALRILRDL